MQYLCRLGIIENKRDGHCKHKMLITSIDEFDKLDALEVLKKNAEIEKWCRDTYTEENLLVRKAVEISLENGKFSTAFLQKQLSKGHGYVSKMALCLEKNGIIGPKNNQNKPRDLLIKSMEEFDEKMDGYQNDK